MENVISQKLFLYLVFIFSAVFHEYAHGWAAYQLGDTTAKDAGRLTLNPLRHLDPIGTVIIPLFLLFTSGIFIGWAKPVPYNPNNLRDQKYGNLKVGVAGPLANLLIAILLAALSFILLIQAATKTSITAIIGSGYVGRAMEIAGSLNNPLVLFFVLICVIIYINIFLALFNLIPLPPLDGSKIFFDLFPRQRHYLERIGFIGIFLALFLAFYFLAPLARLIFWFIAGQGLGI